jgi:ribosome-associated toxin RatA of RatAB toxin-antitoxin module
MLRILNKTVLARVGSIKGSIRVSELHAVFAGVCGWIRVFLGNMRHAGKLPIAGMVVLLFGSTALADAGGVKFTEAELELLKAGEPVRQELPSSRKGGFYGGTGWAVINAPVEKVWAALNDLKQYPDAFPNTKEMFEVSRKGNRSLVRMRLGHPILSVTFHVDMKRDAKSKTLSFKMVENHPHDLDMIKGYWRLFPQKGDRTLVAYVVAFRVPMGIVNLVGPTFEDDAVTGILNAPHHLKLWIETGKPAEDG